MRAWKQRSTATASRAMGCVRRCRWRVQHRHRQGDQPDADQSWGTDGLHQCPRWQGAHRKPLKPLIAVPTTTGTGAESTTICVMDVLALKVKTGISHARLRPTVAVIDPRLTLTQPAGVTASAGMDILCHALESYTARPYNTYEHKTPQQRVPYCGSNPISDMWSEKAMRLLASSFRRAVLHGNDRAGTRGMAMAATFAGMGFGNAGVHIPHANAYPIAGSVRDFRPKDYPQDEPMVPHGMSVALTAPEAFRFTFDARPERHMQAAQLLEPGAECPGQRRGVPALRAGRADERHRDTQRRRGSRVAPESTSTISSRAR